MSTDNQTEAGAQGGSMPDETARRTWFAAFGYTGDPDEQVTLHNAAGKSLGTASAADVWAVRRGLLALERGYNGQFHRVGNWAEAARRPMDVTNRLAESQYGPLTSLLTSDWLPGRREIVCCLLERRADDDILFQFREHPLVNKEEVPKAA